MSNNKMVQYSVWQNCNNKCKFCLLREKIFINKEQQLQVLDKIKENLHHVDWINEFNRGVSLLGGELYFVTDKDVQDKILELIEEIVKVVVKPNHELKNYYCKYSTVTNGMYDPEFLFRCVDKVVEEVGLVGLDINFSYDIKYRYPSEERRLQALSTIKAFEARYPEYRLNVQTICAEYLIQEILHNNFLEDWKKEHPNGFISLLYPHPPHTGEVLPDFFPKRDSMLRLIEYLQNHSHFEVLERFLSSVTNSSIFKYTGLQDKGLDYIPHDVTQAPILSKDKVELNPRCGHSTLYQCYSDSDSCLLCDINTIMGE